MKALVTKISVCALVCVFALSIVSCSTVVNAKVKAQPTIPLPEYTQKELKSYLSGLALDEIFVERLVMEEPPEGELLPSSQKFGVRNDMSELPQAQCKVLADLAEESPYNGMKQVACALLQQECILQIIYMASYPMKLQGIDDKHGLVLANAGVALRDFRQEHPELPGVLAERVLKEMTPWLDIFPEWNVIFSLDVSTVVTNSPAEPQEGEPTTEETFVRNPDAQPTQPEMGDGGPQWFHWMFVGETEEMQIALYLPELPKCTEILINGEPYEADIEDPTLVELPEDNTDDDELLVHLALRLPDDQKDFRAKFPIVLVGLAQETAE